MSLEQQISALARTVAIDQVAQDIEMNKKIEALRSEISGGGADGVQMLEQLIGFYNGYKGTSLDYRDFLDQSGSALDSFYGLGTGYLEAA